MSDLNPDLLKQAEELNIQVTESATNEALQKAIDEVLAEDGAGASGKSVIETLRAAYKSVTGKKAFNGWDAAELQKRIDASGEQPAKPASAPAPKKQSAEPAKSMIPMAINRDIWVDNPDNPDEPIRHRRGKIMEFTIDDAMAGLESGALSRVK
jgi:hypothetical protein